MARIVLLTKTDSFSRRAQQLARALFGPALEIYEGAVGDTRPAGLVTEGKALVSFLSPWIISWDELARFDLAINFHPGSVEYPGSGCYNFALAEEAAEYGAVCHHMLPAVDTGRVIMEARFPLSSHDTVETLKLATVTAMLGLYQKVIELIAEGKPLPLADTHWKRRAFLRREMEALKVIDATLPRRDIDRLLRATVYPGFNGPVLCHPDGSRTVVEMPHRPALA